MRYPGGLCRFALAAMSIAACSKQRGQPPEAQPSPELRVQDPSGRVLTADEIAHTNGTVKYGVVGKGQIPDEARQLHEQGRKAGGAGKYAEALVLFARAHEAAPTWAYPTYDAAFTHQLMDQPDKALAGYEEVLKLEPRGFFNAISSADCLRREAKAEWPAGTCKAYAMVEWLSPDDQRKALEALVSKFPSLAVAWKDLAGHLDDTSARLQALDRGLAQRPDPQTRGFLLMNKASALDGLGKHEEARRMLTALAAEPALPVDVEQLVKLQLSQLDTKR